MDNNIGFTFDWENATDEFKTMMQDIVKVWRKCSLEESSVSWSKNATANLINRYLQSLPSAGSSSGKAIEVQGEESAKGVDEFYKSWCKDTKRNGGVLISSSIKEVLTAFSKWQSQPPTTAKQGD
jgi:hypothetical protein